MTDARRRVEVTARNTRLDYTVYEERPHPFGITERVIASGTTAGSDSLAYDVRHSIDKYDRGRKTAESVTATLNGEA